MYFFRFGLFLNSSATDIVLVTQRSTAVETATARCTSSRCAAMARGHRLNTSIVLAAVHGLSGLFRAVSAVEPSVFRHHPPTPPHPPVPVPNRPTRLCGRKATLNQQTHWQGPHHLNIYCSGGDSTAVSSAFVGRSFLFGS